MRKSTIRALITFVIIAAMIVGIVALAMRASHSDSIANLEPNDNPEAGNYANYADYADYTSPLEREASSVFTTPSSPWGNQDG